MPRARPPSREASPSMATPTFAGCCTWQRRRCCGRCATRRSSAGRLAWPPVSDARRPRAPSRGSWPPFSGRCGGVGSPPGETCCAPSQRPDRVAIRCRFFPRSSFASPTTTISQTILSVIRTGECLRCHDRHRPCRLPSVVALVAPSFGPVHVPGAVIPDDEHGSMAEMTSSSQPRPVAPTPAAAASGGQPEESHSKQIRLESAGRFLMAATLVVPTAWTPGISHPRGRVCSCGKTPGQPGTSQREGAMSCPPASGCCQDPYAGGARPAASVPSSACATASNWASCPRRPTICIPTGKPASEWPTGITAEG
jgi:hypothetical protein